MNPRGAALRRGAHERGATIFIVLLVLTLLTTIGIFSVRSATQVTIAAGNNRQATQSLYFAEGAAALGVAQIGGPRSTLYVDLIYNSQDKCQINGALNDSANANVLGNFVRAPCYRVFSTEIANQVAFDASGRTLFEAQQATVPGSFGPALGAYNVDSTNSAEAPVNAGREGLFVVELTDAFEGPPPDGFNVDDSAFRSITLNLTAFSQVRNTPNAVVGSDLWCGTQSSATTASVQAMRAYVTLPMVSK